MAARSKALFCGRWPVEIVISNRNGGIDIVSVVYCRIDVSGKGRSLVPGIPTDCGFVVLCDLETY